MHRLKRQKRLNNKALESLLGPYIETLDLNDTYLTEGSLKIIMRQCPNLKHLNLRECGYLITDQLVQMLAKVSGFFFLTHVFIAKVRYYE